MSLTLNDVTLKDNHPDESAVDGKGWIIVELADESRLRIVKSQLVSTDLAALEDTGFVEVTDVFATARSLS